MSRVTRGTPAGDAYLDLQNQARSTSRPTQELLQLYVLEGFLARLADSDAAGEFALKGGVLLAALDARRPTKDVDLAGIDIPNDLDAVSGMVRRILGTEPSNQDGIEFDAGSVTAETIREEDAYSGVRVHVAARLATAELSFHVDVNVGDPIWPHPERIVLPRLRGGDPINLQGYPIHMVHAEKIVTAIQRGTANTRWRDFGDIWSLSRNHPISANDLREAIERVARHRNAVVVPLAEVLDGFAALGQARWVQWRRRSNSDHLPESFEAVLSAIVDFADPVLSNAVAGRFWDPAAAAWR